jgi:hypothetical protein
MRKVMFAVATLALTAFAASNTFHVQIDETAWIGGTEVQPGEYKVQMQGDKAILKMGKTVIEVPAKMETVERKFATSGVVMQTVDHKQKVQEIQIGGTKDRIVFQSASPTGF